MPERVSRRQALREALVILDEKMARLVEDRRQPAWVMERARIEAEIAEWEGIETRGRNFTQEVAQEIEDKATVGRRRRKQAEEQRAAQEQEADKRAGTMTNAEKRDIHARQRRMDAGQEAEEQESEDTE